jgi:GNAT superfamily N-acetyltransferase
VDDPQDSSVPGLRKLLAHKDGIWQLHLEEDFGGRIKELETRFYVGAIDEELAGNIMTAEFGGLGVMGHVFTPPEHRRKGICDVLMDFHLDDFRQRKGNALYLNTGYDSPPFHIYLRHGYHPIPEAPGSMWWSPDPDWSPADLWDDLSRVKVCELQWRHWPSANALFLEKDLPIVRNVTYTKYGVGNAEATFLCVMSDLRDAQSRVQARAIESRSGHLAGLATLAPERRWGRRSTTFVFDLCVHPKAGDVIDDVAEEFEWPAAHVLAYAAENDESAIDRYSKIGFRPHSHVERFFDSVGLVVLSRE